MKGTWGAVGMNCEGQRNWAVSHVSCITYEITPNSTYILHVLHVCCGTFHISRLARLTILITTTPMFGL